MSEHRYGCHNKPRPAPDATYLAQSGWSEQRNGQRPMRQPVYKAIRATFGTAACQYDKSATDAACGGCDHARVVSPN